MADKPVNRISKLVNGKAGGPAPAKGQSSEEGSPKPGMSHAPKQPGISFIPLNGGMPSLNGPLTFAIASNGKEQVIQTPFGVVKITIASSKEMAELAEQVTGIFAGGLTAEAIMKLQLVISKLPEVQEMMAKMPGLEQFLGQALGALQAAEGDGFVPMVKPSLGTPVKGPKPTKAARPKGFWPKDMTFERMYYRVDMN